MSEKIARTVDRLVLDTHAVLAFLNDEPGTERVQAVLDGGDPWMTLVNLGEVIYMIERRRGSKAADTVYANLLTRERPDGGRSISWIPVNEVLVRRAASLKARGGMSYADCFAAAAAAILDCPVLTGDQEFVAAEKAGIAVEWL